MLPRLIEQSLDFPDVTQVRADRNSSPPQFLNFLNGLLRLALRTPVMNYYIRALFGQTQPHRASEPLGRTGNKCHLTLHGKVHGQRKYHDLPVNTSRAARVLQTDKRELPNTARFQW